MPSFLIRPMRLGEEQEVALLVIHVFSEDSAPHYSSEEVQAFLRYADPRAMVSRSAAGHWVLVAEEDAKILAMIEVRESRHVAMLFVAGEHHRQGIVRELLREALWRCRRARPGLDGVTVHASPNAVGAYERLGFRPQASEQIIQGIRFTPMWRQLGVGDAG
jgi:ribosomal protein S18 acetylase RimI-like enzyme